MNEKERKNIRKLFKLLFFTSRGGYTRLKIVRLLESGEANANQISTRLGLDYKTVIHHLEVLLENGIVVKGNEKYGTQYKLSSFYHTSSEILSDLENENKGFKVDKKT
ncbi:MULTISPECIES: winged helix-turn-helix domain-containing protein [Acidianus]|uniref:Transcriptional regulator n=1 Tax=Candidatus Acidianus copahuensis TaxID=1160895 RepID=A0A031LLB1_9CREN|nr:MULTISPECIES: winged helix-turn-helix domain-containing protein [Acidianus]EZQ04837.1 transcriptional regulator [Candidatus Acidianus copahuensis]NON62794.1 winged helix-turn-helix transcriptional regulator [Acidianus sp. RZ1]